MSRYIDEIIGENAGQGRGGDNRRGMEKDHSRMLYRYMEESQEKSGDTSLEY
jgi:hypothetical protein